MLDKVNSLRGIAVLLAMGVQLAWTQPRTPLEPADSVSWKDVEGVELSPDGGKVIYTIKEQDLKQNRFTSSLWIAHTSGGTAGARLTDNEKDDSPKWSPDGTRVAFLSTREGGRQIWIAGPSGEKPAKLTSAPGGVLSFHWAPSGQQIGFIARSAQKGQFEEQSSKDAGVVINKWDFVVYKLLNSAPFLELDQKNELWLTDAVRGHDEPLIADKHVTQFAWSPDGRSIAAIFQPLPGLATQRSDVLIYSLASKQSKVILEGTGGRDFDDTTAYSNPVWSPDGSILALLYRRSAARWQAQSDLGLYRLSDSHFTLVPAVDRLVLYQAGFSWTADGVMSLENTVHGSRRRFLLSLSTGAIEPVGEHQGSESHYSFSQDGKMVAFVRQSTQSPPEIFVSKAPFNTSTRLTSLNVRYASLSIPGAERVQWKSTDGVEVEGWVLKPPGFQSSHKYPLMVMVHGGPGAVVPDAFEMYFEWPYPYRLFANRGYVVLLPNYRGTGSYSHAFSKPRDVSDEPVNDIVTGIEHLIGQGFVDSARIGITGHSHGAWLGPQVLTTHPKMFRAASFAEGSGDLVSTYGQMPGWLNLNIHDYYWGGAPFAAPRYYLENSPIFHVVGVTAPTLFEFGDQSLAIQGLEYQTAFWRCGIPSELVIYPRTGHNMTRPVQEIESTVRNLDWFDYWMLGKKDESPAKQEQYKRWEHTVDEMKNMREKHSCTAEPPASK